MQHSRAQRCKKMRKTSSGFVDVTQQWPVIAGPGVNTSGSQPRVEPMPDRSFTRASYPTNCAVQSALPIVYGRPLLPTSQACTSPHLLARPLTPSLPTPSRPPSEAALYLPLALAIPHPQTSQATPHFPTSLATPPPPPSQACGGAQLATRGELTAPQMGGQGRHALPDAQDGGDAMLQQLTADFELTDFEQQLTDFEQLFAEAEDDAIAEAQAGDEEQAVRPASAADNHPQPATGTLLSATSHAVPGLCGQTTPLDPSGQLPYDTLFAPQRRSGSCPSTASPPRSPFTPPHAPLEANGEADGLQERTPSFGFQAFQKSAQEVARRWTEGLVFELHERHGAAYEANLQVLRTKIYSLKEEAGLATAAAAKAKAEAAAAVEAKTAAEAKEREAEERCKQLQQDAEDAALQRRQSDNDLRAAEEARAAAVAELSKATKLLDSVSAITARR